MIVKWVLVAIFLSAGAPVDSGMLGLKTAEDCEKAKQITIEHGHSQGFDVWAECRKVAPVLSRPPATKPNDKKPEVTS
jgi:hypothetical protein